MTSLRVGVDGFNLALPEGTGVATYGVGLAESLAALGHRVEGVFGLPGARDPALREVLFFEALGRGFPDPRRRYPVPLRSAARWLETFRNPLLEPVPCTGRVERRPFADRLPSFDAVWTAPDLWARAERYFRRTGQLLPLRLPDPPAVMHWTYLLPVRMVGAVNLYTVHDLVPLTHPYATLDRKRAFRRLLARVAAGARALVTVSEASRRGLLDWLGLDEARVHNTYQALPALAPAAAGARVFGLEPGGFFLFHGAAEPKKNLARLLEGYLASGVSTPLVLAGAQGWGAERDLALADERRGPSRVVRLGYLPRALLLALVRDARALLFPSLHEGFGLPVLEAMRLGTPVLTSGEGGLAEVAGDAALTVDPYDPAAVAAGVARLDRDAPLRADLARRGLAQADLFSAERYRERLSALYREVLA